MVVTDFLGSESFVLASVLLVQVMIFLQTSNKLNAILFCNFLSLYEWKSVIPIQVRVYKMVYLVCFKL